MRGKKANVIQTLAFASLWMYSLTTIVPLERIIFSTNWALTQQAGSRVDINELKMLSYDTLTFIDADFDEVIAQAKKDRQEKIDRLTLENRHYEPGPDFTVERVEPNWIRWHSYQVNYEALRSNHNSEKKPWYEKTLNEILHPVDDYKLMESPSVPNTSPSSTTS